MERLSGGAERDPVGIGRLRALWRRALIPALALVTAFLAGAVLILVTDFEHLSQLGEDPLAAIGAALDVLLRGYGAMLGGAIGDPGRILAAIQTGSERDIARAIRPLTEALLGTTPILFVTLGVAVALHARLFNFGVGGQYLLGGLGATIAAFALDGILPPFAILVCALGVGTLTGAAWGAIPGALKARTGAHEVITTLMLNTVAFQLALYLGRSLSFNRQLDTVTSVPKLIDMPTIRVDWSFVVALVVAAVVSFLVFRTTIGLEIRAAGFNRMAARAAGMRPARATILAMSFSGGLIGMGGAFLALGVGGGGDVDEIYVPLALALIAGLRPSAIVLVSLLYGLLLNGAKAMVVETGTPFSLVTVIISLALMFVAAPRLIRTIWRRKPDPDGPDALPVGDVGPL